MKQFSTLFIISGLLFLLAIPASSQSRKTSSAATHSFENSDHTAAFQYANPLVLCHEDTPSCQDYIYLCTVDQDTIAPIACLGYGGNAYKGYNFTGAALAIGIVNSAKDETACFDLQGEKVTDTNINGIAFKVAELGDSGAGHHVEDSAYRAFYQGTCYAADLRIATTNFGNYDAGAVKEFKAADRQKVYRKLKQALATLHLSAAAENSK